VERKAARQNLFLPDTENWWKNPGLETIKNQWPIKILIFDRPSTTTIYGDAELFITPHIVL